MNRGTVPTGPQAHGLTAVLLTESPAVRELRHEPIGSVRAHLTGRVRRTPGSKPTGQSRLADAAGTGERPDRRHHFYPRRHHFT